MAGAAQPTNAPAEAAVLADAATVYSVRVDPTQTGGSLVTLVVTPEQGLAISEASSTGNAALIKVPSP